ncbi:MAG: hypothetical protein ABJO02_06560, partial [Reichenbachiella sp.]
MHNLRKYIRVVSAFLLINFLFSTFLPTISYALTSGPTAPEATSFEPIDTTDMVNLQTGDFTYNIPLLEVPGPSGGYPLSLSYHAGIMPGEEASWVGLGWTLNPGAINRTVNGFADDHSDVNNSNHYFWAGGQRSTAEIGITFGISNIAGATVGLSVGHDTYQGFGIGTFLGGNLSFGNNYSGVGIRGQLGSDPWGNMYASAGLSAGIGRTVQVVGNVGVRTNFKSTSVGVNSTVSYSNQIGSFSLSSDGIASFSSLGATISTSRGGSISSVAVGKTNIGNSKTGNITTSNHSISIPLPLIHLGFMNQRYWVSEVDNARVNGAFHYPSSLPTDWHEYDDKAYDTYTLLDPDAPGGIVLNSEPDKVLGGSFPNYDHYSISAQGLSGNIQPYIYQGYLHRQNSKIGDDYNTIHHSNGVHSDKIQFRFVGDFSNQYMYEPPNFQGASDPLNFDFSGLPTTGDNVIAAMNSENHLAGSKHIEYLTNEEIETSSSKVAEIGFIDTNSLGFARTSDKKIGGYVVTNESGVKYHYALPAYASQEYQKSKNIHGTETYNEFYKFESYAYTWYLTAITGPDYVDRGGVDGSGNGSFDEEDWGYWVEFDYGKWTDKFRWRNPAEGTHKDLDSNFENFSSGNKELYYLNSIKTRTHTALFEKEIRADGKGLAVNGEDGQFTVQETHHDFNCGGPVLCRTDHVKYPTSTLALKKIYLLKNKDFSESVSELANLGTNYNHTFSFTVASDPRTENIHWGKNVIDIHDINVLRLELEQKSQRIVEFGHTYDLSPETVNSFDPSGKIYAEDPDISEQANLLGKLTLNSISFLGKKGEGYIPPLQFAYEDDDKLTGFGRIALDNDTHTLNQANSGLVEGDIIKLLEGNKFSYALVKRISGSNHILKVVGKENPSNGFLNWVRTKNPPYNKENRDLWGMYKPDYEDSGNTTVDRLVSKLSAKNADVWSLQNIRASSGTRINIAYESDSYNKSVLQQNYGLIVDDLELKANNIIEMSFVNVDNLTELIDINDKVGFIGSYQYKDINVTPFIIRDQIVSGKLNVVSVQDEKLELENQEIYQTLTTGGGYVKTFYGGNVSLENLGKCGGGIRVASIQVSDGISSNASRTNYNYNYEGHSSGVTAFEPTELENYSLANGADENGFKSALFNRFSKLLSNSRVAPPPGVMYKHITVKESTIDSDGNEKFLPSYSMYNYQTFEENMAGISSEEVPQISMTESNYQGIVYNQVKYGKKIIKDYSSKLGQLISVTAYDNSDKIISKTTNHYLHDQIDLSEYTEVTEEDKFSENINQYELLVNGFGNQGVVEESYVDSRFIRQSDGKYHFLGVVSKRERYPSIQTGQTNINYKTGITTTTENLAFDFYSGAVTKTRRSDGYGNTFVSETTPAYRKYGGEGGMGLAINGGKNMLTQTTANYTWKVNPSDIEDKQALVAADIQTWNNQWAYRGPNGAEVNTASSDSDPVWRKHKAYTYTANALNTRVDADGLVAFNPATFDDFESWKPTDPS